MNLSSPLARLRLLVLFASLVVWSGLSAPPASAQAGPSTATASQQTEAAQPATVADAGRSLAEAYLLLLDHYAVPLPPAQLVGAGLEGMTAALTAAGVASPPAATASQSTDKVEQFAVLQQQYQTLAAGYADKVSPSDLAHAAIRGMADSVEDAHTNFLTAEQYQEEQRWERGDVSYGGIGARMRGPQATVLETFPNSPAARAGLLPGDTIVAVDNRSVTDLRLDEVVRMVRGEAGTPVVLRVQRAATGRADDLTLVRAQVSAPFVTARTLPGNLGYVQLRGFPEPTVVVEVEQRIRQQQRDGVQGIVFDLRGNGGGRLDVGTRLLGRFIPDGPIYQRVDRSGRRETFNVRDARPILTVPLVVLVDESTASMGEVFAAAIQERRIGRVIGATTAGAVAASRFIPLSDGSALQVSLEQVYSGAGALLDRVGVQPDEVVPLDLDQLRQGRDTQLERAISYVAEVAAQRAPAAPTR